MSERTFDSPPNLLTLYGKAALGGIPMADKVPFLGIGGRSREIPETVLVVPEVTVDVDGTTRVSASELVSGARPPLRVVGQCGLAPAALAELARTVAEWRAT